MTVSELDQLDSILLSAFKRFETIPGKKALQKLVYFLKESGLEINLEFQWDRFGPYSPELATYVEDLVAEGLMESETKKLFTASDGDGGVQYNFSLGPRSNQILSTAHISAEEKQKIDRVVVLFKETGPQNLELYATVHYIVKFFSTKSERTRFPEGLFDLVNDYKPDRFSRDQVVGSYYNLKKLHWITIGA